MTTLQEQIGRCKTAWNGLLPRQRKVLTGGAISLALILVVFGVLLPALAWQSALNRDLARLRGDLASMRGLAAQAKSLPAKSVAAPDVAALVPELQTDLARLRLAQAAQAVRAEGPGRLAVTLKSADFDALLGWLEQVQSRHGLRVASARIARAEGVAGAVRADLVLEGGGRP